MASSAKPHSFDVSLSAVEDAGDTQAWVVGTPTFLRSQGGSHPDFPHMRPGLLNNASFGAAPTEVLYAWQAAQFQWVSDADQLYFSGSMQQHITESLRSMIPVLTNGTKLEYDDTFLQQLALVENATVAAAVVAHRWRKLVRQGDLILVLDSVYAACKHCLLEHCCAREGPCANGGARLEVLRVSSCGTNNKFPRSKAEILGKVEEELERIFKTEGAVLQQRFCESENKVYLFLDHITSQPAFVVPVREIVKRVRERLQRPQESGEVPFPTFALGEVCVDGAHSFAVPDLNILADFRSDDADDPGVDWFFSNLHKWGFTPPTACVLWGRSPKLMRETRHPLVSWAWGRGLHDEARWTGTRDYSSYMVVGTAMQYLRKWSAEEASKSRFPFCRDALNQLDAEIVVRRDANVPLHYHLAHYCRFALIHYSRLLASAFGTLDTLPDPELVCASCMVELPRALRIACRDLVGQPCNDGLRTKLREKYRVEAAVGSFEGVGNFVRLSFAVYNTEEDILRLRDAVLQELQEQDAEGS